MRLNKLRLAFTLVEIIVVIAILAIIAALIFPVLARARESAKQTAVSSQLKQVGLAVSMYMSDYDDQAPPTLQALTSNKYLPAAMIICPKSGHEFYYTQSYAQLWHLGAKSSDFNPSSNSVVKAMFWHNYICGSSNEGCTTQSWTDQNGQAWTYTIPGGPDGLPEGKKYKVLGARLDGSVGWFDALEDWESFSLGIGTVGIN